MTSVDDAEQADLRRSKRILMQTKRNAEKLKEFYDMKGKLNKTLTEVDEKISDTITEDEVEEMMMKIRTDTMLLDGFLEDLSQCLKTLPTEISLASKNIHKKSDEAMKKLINVANLETEDDALPEAIVEPHLPQPLPQQLDGPIDNSTQEEDDVSQSSQSNGQPSIQEQSLAQLVNLSRLPAPEPSVFTGDPLNFTTWKGSFVTLVESRNISPKERIHYLQKYLAGEAKESISSLFYLNTEEAYTSAWALLDKRYGNTFLVSEAFRRKLHNWPEIHSSDSKGLQKFADFLTQCTIAKDQIRGLSILDDCHENKKLVVKLPRWIQTDWLKRVSDDASGNYPKFKEFTLFINKLADRVNNPVFNDILQDRNPRKVKPAKTFSTSAQATPPNQNQGTLQANTSKVQAQNCAYCKLTNHILHNCRRFREITPKERSDFIKSNKMCFGCLRYGHRSKDCKRRSKCDVCKKGHPTCLHGDREVQQPPRELPQPPPEQATGYQIEVTAAHKTTMGQDNLTSTIVPVYLSCKGSNKEVMVYALLDTQSDSTFVLENIAGNLEANFKPARLKIQTITSENIVDCYKYDDLEIRGIDSSYKVRLPECYSQTSIPSNKSHIPTRATVQKHAHLKKLERVIAPIQDCEVGLLIGFNCPEALAPLEVILGSRSEPYAQRTALGWTIVGKTISKEEPSPDGLPRAHLAHRTRVQDITTSDILKALEPSFEGESDDRTTMSQEDLRFLKILKEGVHQAKDGHYTMPLPFKEDQVEMPFNKEMAFKRLMTLKNRFRRDEKYFHDYKQFMSNIITDGDAEKLPANEDPIWFIPHHGVYHPRKQKIRVVFDCSATYGNTSLNRSLLQGPDQINSLIGVLCRFRENQIALTSDIERMFHQFRVNEDDRNFLCFLWWEDGDLNASPSVFRMKVHLFGATSSPGCAIFGLRKLAEDHGVKYGQEVENFLRRDFYMDDGLTSCNTLAEAKALVQGARMACAKGHLRLHKFLSNDKDLMESIPESERQEVQTFKLGSMCNAPLERVLGLQWNVKTDRLMFECGTTDNTPTRRVILSTLASIYDPLGCLAPTILKGKLILQTVCKSQFSWDDPLDENTTQLWKDWSQNMKGISQVAIPRCLKPKLFCDIQRELHHFSDACLAGYGSCSYLRVINQAGEVHCSLVFAKARVAPLKPITLPRLELMGAITSVRASVLLRKELRGEVKEYFWTDSKIVLGYIQNSSKRFHMFVANRVEFIREHTELEQWNYVSSGNNPADHASRGLSVEELVKSNWFNGPQFLLDEPLIGQTPNYPLQPEDPEIRKHQVLQNSTKEIEDGLLRRFSKFSEWDRLVTAITTLKMRINPSPKPLITIREDVKIFIIKLDQERAFGDFISGRSNKMPDSLERLDPFLDSEGVLRVGGRLKPSQLAYGVKHPIILPKLSHITELLVRKCHQEVLHQGRSFTLGKVRESGYWIIGSRGAVSSIIFKCVTCKRLRGKQQIQKMGNLPKERLEPSPPFTHIGIDCFGPFLTKEKRKEHKRYGLVVTCLASKAIHIELLEDLTADSFINTLRCVIAIRGPIRTVRCDQGSNFMGAAAELNRAADELKGKQFQSFLQKKQCLFITNPPSASHMGGIWERQIRTIRRILTVMLHQHGSRLDTTTLRTLFYEVMAIINSRPLNVEDLSDQGCPSPITPNNLLTMKTELLVPPPGNFTSEDIYARKRWRQVQALANEFWNKWRNTYLLQLQERQKWQKPVPNLECGDIVLLKDENEIRGQHRMAKIIEATAHADGLVRKVQLLVADKAGGKPTVLFRPVHKLVLLLKKPTA